MPRLLLIPAGLGVAFVTLPLVAMVLAVEWAQMGALLGTSSSLTALDLSLRTSLASTAVCLVLGVPLAMMLARTSFPGLRIVRGLVLLPLVLPPVVGGIALLYTFGRRGLVGRYLEAGGISIAFTTVAVVLAQSFVALPFLVLSLEGAVRTIGHRYEDVAATLGAAPGFVARRVTLPLVLPGIVSGAVLAFARSLGEFGATLTFAGSLEGVTRTLPLEIYLQRETDPDAAVALSLLLIVVAGVIVVTVYGRQNGSPASRRSTREVPEATPVAVTPVTPVTLPRPQDRITAPALRVRGRVAHRGVDIALDVEPGEVVAVLGPNGAGKSTVLGLVSGLVAADEGEVVLGDRVLTDTSRGVQVPVHARGAATLSQEALLFPHLSAAANVGFGPRAHRVPRGEARGRARRWLDAVGAGELAERRPHEVSGGQAQRIALARALASEPGLLLLDEPLAALDVGAAVQMRALLRDVCRAAGRTTLLVTHDLLDVFALADRVVVMEDGVIVEQGPAREVLAAPRSAFAAQLAGVNLVAGVTARHSTMDAARGAVVYGHGAVDAGETAVAVFPPSAVALYLAAPHGSPRNVWAGTVVDLQPRGEGGVRLHVAAAGIGVVSADLTAGAVADLGLAPGVGVHVVVKAQEVALHPA